MVIDPPPPLLPPLPVLPVVVFLLQAAATIANESTTTSTRVYFDPIGPRPFRGRVRPTPAVSLGGITDETGGRLGAMSPSSLSSGRASIGPMSPAPLDRFS